MDCNETRRLLDADTDGELDLVRHLELDAHLGTCPDCARRAENTRRRYLALRGSLPRFKAPPEFAEKIRASLRTEAAPVAAGPTSTRAARAPLAWPVWSITGLAASLAFALLVGYAWGQARTRSNLLVDEAVADHIRSLQASHLTDVASTDQHTVKPWFAGKLDFSPPVVDLASAGFPLTGGRLEHLDGRPAAALIFHRRQHAINLFIWPVDSTVVSSRRDERHGYNAETWSQAGLNFLAVSEIPKSELTQFVETFRANSR